MTRLADQELEARRQMVARCAELIRLHDAGDVHGFELKLRAVMEGGDIWRSANAAHRKSWARGAA